jgi:hypothetical protein
MSEAKVARIDEKTVEVSFRVKLSGSLLQNEEQLQAELNGAGAVAMEEILSRFDADGTPIVVAGQKLTSRGRFHQRYETPYGSVDVERHIYQTSRGGRTYCPLEESGRFILNATPRYAKMVSAKYCRLGATAVCDDLLECNGRGISVNYVKKISDYVGGIAQAKEEAWEYALPEFDRPVHAITIGLDGTCMLMKESGWREAMCGSIGFYDADGERMHTIYTGAAPEYGKARFHEAFSREIERVKLRYPEAIYIGLADGAADNWSFLEGKTDRQMIDFYHARGYVGKAVATIHWTNRQTVAEVEEDWSHDLKHTKGAARRILKRMEASLAPMKRGERMRTLRDAATYFRNHAHRMQYWRHVEEQLPIGSGVTEAACKTLIKERLCKSGMRWKDAGAAALLSIRALKLTPQRWESFWEKIDRYGAFRSN